MDWPTTGNTQRRGGINTSDQYCGRPVELSRAMTHINFEVETDDGEIEAKQESRFFGN